MYIATAFVLFCIACSVLAFTRHPIYGLYFYLATTFVYPPARWWGSMLPDLRWALVAAVVTTLAVVFHRGKLNPKPVWISNGPAALLALYAAWMWLQTPWALDLDDHLNGTTVFTKSLLAFWFVYRVVDSKERVRDMLFAHVLGCGLLGIFARYAGRTGGRLDGVGGPMLDEANTLGMYLVTGAIVAIGLILTQSGWRRYVSLASLVLIANGVVLVNSRGAFLALVVGVLALAFCKAKQHRRMFWSFVLVGCLGLPLIVDRTFVERMFTIQDVASDSEDADTSARSRVVIAKAQLQMFLEHPLGTGFRGTAVLSPHYMDRRWLAAGDDDTAARSSHNTYLTALVEQGVPGAAMYAGLILWVAAAALRLRRLDRWKNDPELTTLGAALCAALLVVLTAGITADYLIKEVQFWLYAALVSVFLLGVTGNEASRRKVGAAGIRQIAA